MSRDVTLTVVVIAMIIWLIHTVKKVVKEVLEERYVERKFTEIVEIEFGHQDYS